MDYQEEFKLTLLSHPHCILGKSGITNEFISHLTKLLKRLKIVKVKALKTATTKSSIRDLAKKISNLTTSYLLDIRGNTFILSLNSI